MVTLTEIDLNNKYKAASPRIKEFLNSPSIFELIKIICQNHSITDDDTIETIDSYIAYVLLGFLEPKKLFSEVVVYIPTDEKITAEIIREINFQIFFPLHRELENLYGLKEHIERGGIKIGDIKKEDKEKQPQITREKTEKEKTIHLEAFNANIPTEKEPGVQVETPPPSIEPPKEGQPLIIHREESLTEERKPSFRGFSFPGFFKSKKPEAETPTAVKVRVETPGEPNKPFGAAQSKKEEKRVVHYSEFRTPITPFADTGEFINLEKFSKAGAEMPSPKPPTLKMDSQKQISPIPTPPPQNERVPAGLAKTELPRTEKDNKKFFWFLKNNAAQSKTVSETAKPPMPKTQTTPPEQKPQPKLEGNTVDLSQNA